MLDGAMNGGARAPGRLGGAVRDLISAHPGRRFTIVDGHQSPPHGRFTLSISAGPAFGSGRHETTQGCLLALDWLARRRRVSRAFDIGTGSGILAVAAARLWPARVLALDSDPMAVAAARETVRRNALSRRVAVIPGRRLPTAQRCAAGSRRSDLRQHQGETHRGDGAGFRPASQPRRRRGPLRPSRHRGALVLAAFRNVRLRLRRRIRLGDWATLILTR